MDLDLGKLWMAGVGLVVGAIAGGWIWAHRAAAAVHRAAAGAGEDALLEVAGRVGTGTLAASLKGAAVGGAAGVLLVAAYLYFTNPDRGMTVRRVRTGDEEY